MTMKLRIATVGVVRANVKNVPSPTLDSMIDHVAHPEKHTHDLVTQEAEMGHRAAPTSAPQSIAPPPASDLVAEIKRTRGGK
jgi:hypothetical protein